jgi:hypothetical protein
MYLFINWLFVYYLQRLSYKSPGVDQILAELIQAGGETL